MNEYNHHTYPRPFIRLRPSKTIHGEIGAFSLKNFKKGDIIVNSSDFEDNNIMSVEEYEKLDETTKEMLFAHSTMTPTILFIPRNLNFIKPINYFNHSCEANTGFDSSDNYVAIKDISPGDEFLLDYSLLNTNPDYHFECRCGAPICRKVITGNEWKNDEYWNKNLSYFASTIREMRSLSSKG